MIRSSGFKFTFNVHIYVHLTFKVNNKLFLITKAATEMPQLNAETLESTRKIPSANLK